MRFMNVVTGKQRLLLMLVLSAALGGFASASEGDDPNHAERAPAVSSSRTLEFSAADVEFFEKQVRPILVEHCYECHAGREASGGLLIDTRDGLLRGGDSGAAIVAGSAQESLLIEAVRYENLDLQMPPQGKLDESQIKVLQQWVERGAPDPRTAPVQATRKPGDPTPAGDADGTSDASHAPMGMSLEEGRLFWSFLPMDRPEVPVSQSGGWVQTPIDAFIWERLEAHGLQPAPPADRETLIRRLTYDLTGLPPTIEEIDAFVQDDSPQAYKRVVERLLASEQYGVRWGRHWLDVARYADSNGLDENLAFGNAWRYRDYVVDAFNQDKPFDRFVMEQLAGDLLPDADEVTRTATGFLVLGAKVLAEPDREKLEMDTIDEQLDTLGKSLLGMTFGCVRCHDHKFDPISQRDYYALATIFKSTRTFADTNTGAIKHWNEHLFASEEELAALKRVDDEIAGKKKAAADHKNKSYGALREQARALATEYLVAATRVHLEMSLSQVEEVARSLGLHPRILHHCRRHLHFNQDDPLFAPWHAMAGEQHDESVEAFYRPLFTRAMEAGKAKPESGAAAPQEAELTELETAARAAILDNSGFLAVPPKPEFALDATTLAEYHRLMEEARITESIAPDARGAMGVTDGEITLSVPIHIRGSHRNLGEPVARDVPAVLRSDAMTLSFPEDQSGRLQLAQWLVDDQHPLTARVYVNRLWRWHFGQGIVGTTENFGVLGDRPSHPELLDWLARYLVESGWSTKQMHRLIVHSSTYQQQSQSDSTPLASEIDPDNRLLWRFPMQRLEAEQIHDSILVVCGQLDQRLEGKTVPLRNRQFVFDHTSIDHTKYDSPRRAIFLPVIRNNLFTTFEQFDFPDPTMPTGNRGTTTVAPQALLLMNSETVVQAAASLANRLLSESVSDRSRIELAFQHVLRRAPTLEELDLADELIQTLNSSADADRETAWLALCQGLIASNEFVYLR